MSTVSIIDILLAAMLVVALYTDILRGKIYNKLTFTCIGLGLVLNATLDGWSGARTSLLGIGLGFALFIALTVFGQMKGGDTKLLLAIGSFKGWEFLMWTMLFTALAGGVLAIITLVYKKRAQTTLADMTSRAFANIVLNAPVSFMPTKSAAWMRYSVAIAAGVIAAFVRLGADKHGV